MSKVKVLYCTQVDKDKDVSSGIRFGDEVIGEVIRIK